MIVPFHKNLTQLQQCLAAIRVAGQSLPDRVEITELIVAADGAKDDPAATAAAFNASVLTIKGPLGPAAARNRGSAIAKGNVLVFVDTDVVVAPASLGRLGHLFVAEPDIAAAFGAYDDSPASQSLISQARNLGHSFVHHQANREAETFWAGLGAVRSRMFAKVAGFDERYRRPCVEDIDLGYRIRAAGGQIVVDPSVQGKHLKHWTFSNAIVTDVRDRGIPWTQLMRRYSGMRNDLNVTFAYRLCVVVAYLLIGLLAASVWQPRALIGAAAALVVLWLLDWRYYRYFARERGLGFALRWFPFHILHHLSNGVSFVVGTALSLLQPLSRSPLPGALPVGPWPPAPPNGSPSPQTSAR